MRALFLTAVVTWNSLRSLPQRSGAALAAIVGVAGVVSVMVAVLSIAEGFERTLESTGSSDTAIVMRGGTDTEMNSSLDRQDVRIIEQAPGVLRDGAVPVASSELLVLVDLNKRGQGTPANVPFRGVEEEAFRVRPAVRIVEGRRFDAGRNEIVAGRGAAGQFEGLDVGGTLRLGQNDWTVVGIFEAGGAISESELWADARVLAPAYMRGDMFQSVYARLESDDAFFDFKDALTTDPRLDVKVERESEYYAAQSRTITGIVRALGFLVAGLMGTGAAFGALNTMYAAVASRSREIATLRALGFGPGPVVASVLAESLAIAALGGIVGALAAWLAFDGYTAATLNWDSFSQVAFAFAVTPTLMAQGIVYALVLGLIGGLFPAVRAARIPVATALREL